MTNKISTIAFSLLFLFLSVAVSAQSGIKELKDEAFADQEVSAARFDHTAHSGRASCSRCHHVYEDGEKVPGEVSMGKKCSDCHKVGKGKLQLKYAYHTQCIGCHMERDKGPVLCSNCHESSTRRIDEEVYARSAERPAALFTHKSHVRSEKHKESTCSKCHHTYQKNKMLSSRILGQECSDCHLKEKRGYQKKLSLRNAYHQMCIDCHQQENSGPLACGECHKKY